MRNKTPKHSASPIPTQTTTLTESILKEAVDSAENIIPQCWFCDESDHCVTASLFSAHEVAANFISTVNNLHSAITIFLASNNNASSSKLLLRSHQLIHIAMKRLGREFHCILKKYSPTHRLLDCMVSVDSDNNSLVSKLPPQATGDLKSIAACMVNCGFSKECGDIYKTIRKAAVDEALYRLGMDPLSLNLLQISQRLDWEAIESKIRNWLSAIKIALKAVFSQERILCDLVFSACSPIRKSCFSEVAGEGALSVLTFPEQAASKCRKSPERLFRILDLYEAISELAPEIAATFSSDSSSAVRLQAETSLEKLREAARTALAEFESAIKKDSSSKNPVAGGGVHPLTRYVMNYLAFLSDYTGALEGILATWQLNLHAPLPEEYAAKESKVAVRFMWLLLVLLSKLDGKSEIYKDVSLSYLFLANNLRYVVNKVRTSGLRRIVGERWIAAHEEKVRQYAASYERTGWTKVNKALISEAEESLERAKARFRDFNAAFLEVQRRHMEWVVVDPELREDIKDSLARNIVSKYRHMYTRYRGKLASRNVSVESVVKYAPEDLENYLWGLLFGCSDGDSTSRGRASNTTSLLSSASSSPSMSPLLRTRCHK